ncbi:helix-turn-helix domain-containing protein [Sutcliffiella rhizosphaerae]|uniref:helix-turn-helix domain-containing protein n=1 Tax=Sutcliffiella rhizosphaerae TaxID=2880967 RepID=UPI0037DA1216
MKYLNPKLIGDKIKELRINAGYSQRELADGICPQAQISKIERGSVFPIANTLFHISEKVGVDPTFSTLVQHQN